MSILTVAIPFYNAEKYLRLAIESVLNQTYKDLTILLVDDGSNDLSLSIAQNFAKNDSRVKIFSDGENKNLGYRLNQIPSLIDTEYLARMDADDIMHPEKIEKQMKVLQSHPEIDVLGTNAYSIDGNNNVNGIRLGLNKDEILRKVNDFIHPTIVAKTEWFINNSYDIKAVRIEDSELWFRTSNKNNFQILVEPLFFYRELGNNYYKKYLNGFGSMIYVLKKHKYNLKYLNKTLKYFLSGLIFFLFNLFGKEAFLIEKRNSVKTGNLTIDEVLKITN